MGRYVIAGKRYDCKIWEAKGAAITNKVDEIWIVGSHVHWKQTKSGSWHWVPGGLEGKWGPKPFIIR